MSKGPRHGRARSRAPSHIRSLPAGAISSYRGAPVFHADVTSESVLTQHDGFGADAFGMVLVGIGPQGRAPVAYALLGPAEVDELRLQLTAAKASALRLDRSDAGDAIASPPGTV